MSARTRFIAQPKDKDSSKADGGGTDAPPRPRTDVSPTVPTDVRAPLNDSSNTPRLSHQSLHADDQAANISMTKNPTGTGNGPTSRGIDKPLNIANLRTSAKNKKAGDTTSNHTKKPRGSAADRLKVSEPLSRVGSPKAFMSGRRIENAQTAPSSFMLNPTDGSTFNAHNDTEMSQARAQARSDTETQMRLSAGNVHNLQTSRLPVPSPRRGIDSLASSTSTLYAPLSPTSNMAQNRNLEPARRELFPLRSGNHIDTAHIRSSLSPPPPGQRHPGSDQIFDMQIPLEHPISGKEGTPINIDAFEGLDNVNMDQHNQGRLRRTTKRIGQQTFEEDVEYARLGKRMRTDEATKEVENFLCDYDVWLIAL